MTPISVATLKPAINWRTVFVVLILVLLFRPSGILGQQLADRA
jgi:branched-subunit amino acid ABC-type transport system permease component